MGYDENLANRVRELVGSEPDLTERKMYGGLVFLIEGNLPWPQAAKAEYWFA
jgi:hypothetical protein